MADLATAPLVIAHRGASGYRPEHTLASYELAARMGADYLEPDLVSTADGVLVARHEPGIGQTTDVAAHPEFAARRTVREIDGIERDDWFADDFTAAELRTLRAVERLPQLRQGNTVYDGLFPVPTFDEILELRARLSAELGREIGVYPETKSPTYFARRGLACEPALVASLRAHGLDRADSPVFVQSFETANLRALRTELPVRLVQLIDAHGAPADLVATGDPRTYAELVRPDGLAWIAEYAAAIGPAKSLVLPPGGAPTPLVSTAHAVGLLVHAWTFRNENSFLPESRRRTGREADHGDVLAEYRAFVDAGVDGLFTDQPDTARVALDLVGRGPAARTELVSS
ncbi:glycerophosphodiester phosphodiesterase [Pseudonocardia ailaonensis]|uniref:glycerophosphodiester phosphodiesterase n=1 Tax=Pseudonocardia ailaonensis TaxID=367279 RepID=A0ABN2NI79_9PSEU